MKMKSVSYLVGWLCLERLRLQGLVDFNVRTHNKSHLLGVGWISEG